MADVLEFPRVDIIFKAKGKRVSRYPIETNTWLKSLPHVFRVERVLVQAYNVRQGKANN